MRVILVYSGKGGVGKSTISYNIAYYLKKEGHKVGLFDADFNTPSIHKLVSGLPLERKVSIENFSIKPAIYEDMFVQSTGFINDNIGVIWNEDYIRGALYQFMSKEFQSVDFLIIDMPPGINEVHSEICKLFPNSEALLVISPSELSAEDTVKAHKFLKKVRISILGTIINMSYLTCEHCGKTNNLYPIKSNQMKSLPFVKDSYFLYEYPYSRLLVRTSEAGLPLLSISENDELKRRLKSTVKKIISYNKK